MTPAFRRIAIAAVAIALVAAACGGSDPNSETPADTVGYHGDPDLSDDDTGSDDDTADDHDTDSDDSDTADDTGSDDDTADDHDTDSDDSDTADDTGSDDDTADDHDTDSDDSDAKDDHDGTDDTDDDNDDNDDDAADHHDTGGEEDTGSGGGRHGSADAPTRYDADAAQTITVQVVGGSPVGGHQRVEVELGSVVALTITADTTEEVHVHGYDILRAVSDGHPTHFAFTAEIPGVFEVELEGSGRLLLQLEIS